MTAPRVFLQPSGDIVSTEIRPRLGAQARSKTGLVGMVTGISVGVSGAVHIEITPPAVPGKFSEPRTLPVERVEELP